MDSESRRFVMFFFRDGKNSPDSFPFQMTFPTPPGRRFVPFPLMLARSPVWRGSRSLMSYFPSSRIFSLSSGTFPSVLTFVSVSLWCPRIRCERVSPPPLSSSLPDDFLIDRAGFSVNKNYFLAGLCRGSPGLIFPPWLPPLFSTVIYFFFSFQQSFLANPLFYDWEIYNS